MKKYRITKRTVNGEAEYYPEKYVNPWIGKPYWRYFTSYADPEYVGCPLSFGSLKYAEKYIKELIKEDDPKVIALSLIHI